MYRYTFTTEYDIPKACWGTEEKPNAVIYNSCPFFYFHGIECSGNGGTALNCECCLVPWTGKTKTPKFTVQNGKRWERCPISRKREVKNEKQ